MYGPQEIDVGLPQHVTVIYNWLIDHLHSARTGLLYIVLGHGCFFPFRNYIDLNDTMITVQVYCASCYCSYKRIHVYTQRAASISYLCTYLFLSCCTQRSANSEMGQEIYRSKSSFQDTVMCSCTLQVPRLASEQVLCKFLSPLCVPPQSYNSLTTQTSAIYQCRCRCGCVYTFGKIYANHSAEAKLISTVITPSDSPQLALEQ